MNKVFSFLGAFAACSAMNSWAGQSTLSTPATVTAPTTLAIGLGSSLPADLAAQSFTENIGPSRATGGEIIEIRFKTAKTVQSVRLSAYSQGGQGKVLLHNAEASVMTDKSTQPVSTSLGELFDFNQKGRGLYTDYQNMVMLSAGGNISTALNQSVSSIRIQAEGFTNDDNTLYIEVTAIEPFNYYDFQVFRHSPGYETPPPGGFVLREGNFYCGASWMSQNIMSVRGNEILLTNVNPDGTVDGSFSMTCDWNGGTCREETQNGMCASYNLKIVNSSSFIWSNPCTGSSGACRL